jgi:omega-amidase
LGDERSSWIVREIPNTLLSATQLTLRVAIAQMQMHWTIEENVAEILRAISIAKREGAQLCVFPEMAMRAVQDACAANHIAAILGAPTFGANNAIYNSAVFVDERGEQIAAVAKIGLTVPEATFFTHGTERRIVSMLGLSMSAVLCIEIHDRESIMKQLAASDAKTNRKIDLLAWPGIMRPDPNAANANEEKHIEDARQLARETGAWIVQANWPNSLNYPAESAFAGQSVVIDPSGEFAVRLPIAQAGVGVFSLGSTQFSWHVS